MEHIRDAVRELANLAEKEGSQFLCYLLRMAAEQADAEVEQRKETRLGTIGASRRANATIEH